MGREGKKNRMESMVFKIIFLTAQISRHLDMQQRGNKEFARYLPTSVAYPSLFEGGSKITRSNGINEAKKENHRNKR
jgi:hypothetical protein